MTVYYATQVRRRLEREIRKQKNRSVLAASAGDDEMRREAQMKINQLTGKYKDLSDTFGLKTKAERMQMSGYHPVKAVVDNSDGAFGKKEKNVSQIFLLQNTIVFTRDFLMLKIYQEKSLMIS